MSVEFNEKLGLFIDKDPVASPDDDHELSEGHIFPYARFRSLEHVSFGLIHLIGDEEIERERVGEYGMEPIAAFNEFNHALDTIRKGSSKHAFEEVPDVEVTSEEEYEEALEALGADESEEGHWEGPGLYDFRDMPPTFVGTVEEQEMEAMEQAADEAFEFMFQGEEWEDAYDKLVDGFEGEEGGDDEDEPEGTRGRYGR